jgi:MOSC domain-containing protein YiiM
MSSIYSIVYQPKDQAYPEGHVGDFIRVPVQTAELVANHGIAGDRKAGHNTVRQLNLLDCDWLREREAEGFQAGPGQFGEQLILEGLDVLALQPGDQLQLGSLAIIEVTKGRTGCLRLAAAHGKEELLTVGPIGILAKVVVGGPIQVGDPVTVLIMEGAFA